jgi:hypothetical protein
MFIYLRYRINVFKILVFYNYGMMNPLTPNDLYRRRAVSPLKIKIPEKISAGSVARRDLIPALNG